MRLCRTLCKRSKTRPKTNHCADDQCYVCIYAETHYSTVSHSVSISMTDDSEYEFNPFVDSDTEEDEDEEEAGRFAREFNNRQAAPAAPAAPTAPIAPSPVLSNREIENRQRVAIYEQSKRYLQIPGKINELRAAAQTNLDNASQLSIVRPIERIFNLYILEDDTLDCAMKLTNYYGQRFAVLNMANAYTIGGGYLKGASAQEENLFRRTTIPNEILKRHRSRQLQTKYNEATSQLINGETGRVYIPHHPSVCFRGKELHSPRNVQGYAFLWNDELFDFWELRSAAINLKNFPNVDPNLLIYGMQLRIRAQLDTLIERNIKHVVLSAFGCGAFGNDPTIVAQLYASEIYPKLQHFSVIAFAIYYAGLGPNNYVTFKDVFETYYDGLIPIELAYPQHDVMQMDVGGDLNDDEY